LYVCILEVEDGLDDDEDTDDDGDSEDQGLKSIVSTGALLPERSFLPGR
jgi:hypothetical protein